MNRNKIERYKLEFEQRPDTWRSYGMDLVDAGSPNPCDQSPIARKVLCGRWQEAYQDWLAAGEFSRGCPRELFLAFILATEAIFHRRTPAPVPADLPKRIWSDTEFEKDVRQLQDIDHWNDWVATLQGSGKTEAGARKKEFAKLLSENKPQDAEAFYRENEMDQDEMAEQYLAMARTCAHAHGVKADAEHASKTMWFFADDFGQCWGPLSETELKRAFECNKLLRSTLVWKEGMITWKQATLITAFWEREYSGALPPPLRERV